MTFDKWRYFPTLIKEEVLKNFDQRDKLSFATCSKRSLKLLSGIPNQLNTVIITEESVIVEDDFQFSLEDLSLLIASKKSTIEDLTVFIETNLRKSNFDKIVCGNGSKGLLNVKSLEMEFNAGFYELYKKTVECCDPSYLEAIKIPQLCTQQIYDLVMRTPQWKTCEEVHLNTGTDYRHSSTLQINLDDFLHFKNIHVGIESINREDAWKLIQMYRACTGKPGKFEVTTRQQIPLQEIMNTIDTEIPFAWRRMSNNRGIHVPGMSGYFLKISPSNFFLKGEVMLIVSNHNGLAHLFLFDEN